MTKNVASYFDRTATSFNSVYGSDSFVRSLFNRAFRKALFRFHDITMKECGDCRNKDILDVGCGPGVYVESLIKARASVTGIDVSEAMLEYAAERMKGCENSSGYRLVKGDIMTTSFDRRFDFVLAIGLMDYAEQPEETLKKLKALSQGILLITFPLPSQFRMRLRQWRYRINGVKIRFFEPQEIFALLSHVGLIAIRTYLIPESGGSMMVVASSSISVETM